MSLCYVTAEDHAQHWPSIALRIVRGNMTTELATREHRFDREQVDLIKRTIAKGATDDELKLFMAQCERTGLDPFDRQIYFIKRKQKNKKTGQWEEVGQTQTSIDGFRVVAERTGEMDGQDVAWCGADGVWRDVWLSSNPPSAARVVVYRKGCAHGFPAIATFTEYVQTYDDKPTGMWVKMPANQIAKCAEALALRKAFPKQLSGLYTRDEMAQADQTDVPKGYVVEAPGAPPAQVVEGGREDTSRPNVGDIGQPVSAGYGVTQHGEEVPADGQLYVSRVATTDTRNKNVKKTLITFSNGEQVSTIKPQLASLAEQCCQECCPVTYECKATKFGLDLVSLRRLTSDDTCPEPMLTSDDISF